MKRYALVVAGGTGTRMGTPVAKQFLHLAGRPVLMHTLIRFATCDEVILVLPATQIEYWEELCRAHHFEQPHTIIAGGSERFYSVLNGLAALPDTGLVAIHDGVRPCVTPEVINVAYETAAKFGNAIAAVKSKDSIRKVEADGYSVAVNRSEYFLVQTPQTFSLELLKKAYCQPYKSTFTDDASVVESAGHQIYLIEGDYKNIKITTPEDLPLAELFLIQ